MIIRLMAIDPRPRPGSTTDVVVYQLPEKSREYELLVELLEQHNISWATLEPKPRKPKERSHANDSGQ